MTRLRRPDKDLEKLLKLAEQQGWRVEKSKTYFKILCACDEKHKKWVHLTPSDPSYARNTHRWLQRCNCWKEP